MEKMEFHRLANIFPLMNADDLAALAADIEANGLLEPIVTLEGKILDGRNRYLAIESLGLMRELVDTCYIGFSAYCEARGLDLSPVKFVLSRNLPRRHLTESQRAWAAGKLADMRQGERSDLAGAAEGESESVSVREAAAIFRVSERLVTMANQVARGGIDDLQAGVARGEIVISVADELSRLAPVDQEKALRQDNPKALSHAAKQERRARKERALAEKQRALPDRKYGVIYLDPPWKFEVQDEATGMDRAAENHYPTMTGAEISALPIGDLAAPDCVMFLWVTVPFLAVGLALLTDWGFEYRSHYVWQKDKVGTGYWSRNNHELLLIGARGRVPAPAAGMQWQSCQSYPVGRHSAKPAEFRRMIESYFPDLPKIELFAREAAAGWDCWGKEAPKADGRADGGDGKTISMTNDKAAGDMAASADKKRQVRRLFPHSEETDRIIREGYANGTATREIAASMGLPPERIGVVHARANRLGVTDKARQGARVDL